MNVGAQNWFVKLILILLVSMLIYLGCKTTKRVIGDVFNTYILPIHNN